MFVLAVLCVCEVFLKSQFSPAPRCSHMSQMGNSSEDLDSVLLCALTSAGLWSLALCGGGPPASSLSDRIGPQMNDTTVCLCPVEADWHSARAKLALSFLIGKISLQSSSTSRISCCLPKIRIITAAHPASHCHHS